LSETVEQNPCTDRVIGTANRPGLRNVLIVRSSRVQHYHFVREEIESLNRGLTPNIVIQVTLSIRSAARLRMPWLS